MMQISVVNKYTQETCVCYSDDRGHVKIEFEDDILRSELTLAGVKDGITVTKYRAEASPDELRAFWKLFVGRYFPKYLEPHGYEINIETPQLSRFRPISVSPKGCENIEFSRLISSSPKQ